MPLTRRKAGNAAAAARTPHAQSTLSFGSKSRVTKPSATSSSTKKAKDDPALTEIISQPISTPEPEQLPTSEIAIRQQAKVEVAQPKSDDERKAGDITDVQLKRYWKKEEEKRKAPRVHQEGLSVNEKILRHFDLSSQYGPCIGIARMKRWKRANSLNLHPPVEVLAVLLKEEAKENVDSQRAYVDKLLSSRYVID